MPDDAGLVLPVDEGRDFFIRKSGDEVAISTPDGHRAVHVRTMSTPLLEDLMSLRRDLELARLFASQHLNTPADALEAARSPELALAVAAVVMYGRAFATGVRETKPEIDDLPADMRTAHQHLIDLRNKHVSHSVNWHESVAIVAYLTDNAFEHPGIKRLGQIHMEYAPLTNHDAETLVSLCDLHLQRIKVRSERVRREVFEELKQLGEATVYAFPDVSSKIVPTTNVSKSRKRK